MTMLVRPAITRFSASWISDLGFAVEVAGGLVQHQDARVFEDHPRQGDALLLAAAQAVAALADHRIVALGQLDDELVDVRGAGSASISAWVASSLA